MQCCKPDSGPVLQGRTKQDAVHLLELIIAAQVQHSPELHVNVRCSVRRRQWFQRRAALGTAQDLRAPKLAINMQSCACSLRKALGSQNRWCAMACRLAARSVTRLQASSHTCRSQLAERAVPLGSWSGCSKHHC